MRFVIDADLPRSAADVVRGFGHELTDVRDVGLRGAPDEDIAAYAIQERSCLLTGDYDFADIRNYPPARYHGIVVWNRRETLLRLSSTTCLGSSSHKRRFYDRYPAS